MRVRADDFTAKVPYVQREGVRTCPDEKKPPYKYSQDSASGASKTDRFRVFFPIAWWARVDNPSPGNGDERHREQCIDGRSPALTSRATGVSDRTANQNV